MPDAPKDAADLTLEDKVNLLWATLHADPIFTAARRQIDEARATWPRFAECEPAIIESLRTWPHLSLRRAYELALEKLPTERMPLADTFGNWRPQ